MDHRAQRRRGDRLALEVLDRFDVAILADDDLRGRVALHLDRLPGARHHVEPARHRLEQVGRRRRRKFKLPPDGPGQQREVLDLRERHREAVLGEDALVERHPGGEPGRDRDVGGAHGNQRLVLRQQSTRQQCRNNRRRYNDARPTRAVSSYHRDILPFLRRSHQAMRIIDETDAGVKLSEAPARSQRATRSQRSSVRFCEAGSAALLPRRVAACRAG